jgi:hypothetical protein
MGTDGLLTPVPDFVSRVFALPLLPDPKPQTPDPFSSLPLSSSRVFALLTKNLDAKRGNEEQIS